MFISKSCSYGIRSVVYLAGQPKDKYVSIRDISSDLNISYHFLTKILQMLTAANILYSSRGAGGGVILARPASSITLHELVVAVDGDELFTGCLLRLPGCGQKTPCPMHRNWETARGKITHFCGNTSVIDLYQGLQNQDGTNLLYQYLRQNTL